MAPGDREWTEADIREKKGIPLDPATLEAFRELVERFQLDIPVIARDG